MLPSLKLTVPFGTPPCVAVTVAVNVTGWPWADGLTDELMFKYYILFNGNLFTGEVTHLNIPAGREKRSVMYVPPRALARFANNRPITENSCQNIAVQIVQQGTLKNEASLAKAPPQWYSAMPQVSGLLLTKDQTPFAPLYWDRYEQIKSR